MVVLVTSCLIAITTATVNTRQVPAALAAQETVPALATAGSAGDAANLPTTPKSPVFDPALDQQLAVSPMTTVLVRLNTDLTGTDQQRAASAQSAVNQLLATLPTGSYADVAKTGVLPIASFQASRAAVDALKASPLVRAVGADEPMTVASAESNYRSGAAASNANGVKGDGTVIAVIDSGIESSHPYLMRGQTSKVIGGACFTTDLPQQNFQSPCPNETPTDINGASSLAAGAACTWSDIGNGCAHGTHIGGIIAGEPGTTGFGDLSGVAPNTKLIALQVFGYKSDQQVVTALTSDVLTAMQWLYNRRADFPGLSAVNISIASTTTKYSGACDTENAAQQDMFAAVQALRDVGIATIVAAGNSGWNDGVSSPACLSNTIGVGAIDDTTGQRASFSNLSTAVELFAPGTPTPSSWPGYPSTPKMESGTSQATPAVAGAWALLRQKYPISGSNPKSVTDILNLLSSTGTKVSTTVTLASGSATYIVPSININRALGMPAPTRVAAGTNFACTRDDNGTVACSGANDVGQLSINPATTTTRSIPARVTGISGAADITAGDNFACAIITPGASGTVRCWGSNNVGQLGNGSTANAFTPGTVQTSAGVNLSGVSSVSSKSGSTCAVLSAGVSGTVKCWGQNTFGQLGDGTSVDRSRPVDVKASGSAVLSGVKAVSMGTGTACALMNTGTVRCWGSNAFGSYGNNTTTTSTYPVAVSGINGIGVKASSVSVGFGYACAVLTTGALKCWGINTYGQLGNTTTTQSLVPVDVKVIATPATQSQPAAYANLAGVTAVSVGSFHACAIALVAGISQVFCWGYDGDRQLGGALNGNRSAATAMFGSKSIGAKALIASPFGTMIAVPNALDAVGRNTDGQLGLGTTTNRIIQTWSLRF